MTETTLPATHDLKRVLRLGDLVLFNVVAVLGLRWVATSARTTSRDSSTPAARPPRRRA